MFNGQCCFIKSPYSNGCDKEFIQIRLLLYSMTVQHSDFTRHDAFAKMLLFSVGRDSVKAERCIKL